MLNNNDILETIQMIREENLDIRTVTLGISLLDCADSDIDKACSKVYDKITRLAENHVLIGEKIEAKYGIPIINKRISVTPISMLMAAVTSSGNSGGCVKFAHALQKAADTVGVNYIGGYSALVHKGFSAGDRELILSIPQALAETSKVCSSINVGSTRAGINMDAVALMGKIIKESSETTANNSCFGAAKIVVFCNAVEDNPFMAGAFHGIGEPDCVINVGVSGPGVVRSAISKPEMAGADIGQIAEVIKRTAFKITRMGQLVGTEAARALGVPFGIVDLSLAPTPAIGDSVAYILEEMGLEKCGAYGTTAALALLNDAVKKGGVMASSSVGGLSGAFIPVSEDAGMIEAVKSGSLSLAKLEAMTAVCSVGLDMVVVPGSTSADVVSGIIADQAAIGMINSKTTAVRVIPAIDKDGRNMEAGEILEFGGLFGSGPVMEINNFSPAKLLQRGGRIPAPLQSLKN
ncbi:MAG: PFL family protein [Oscillospiraceae bacterium]|nr:PFL family protein [Oscillospiraceae bacterium]